jgi:uncharacterized protein (TIGR02594 family)
MPINFNILSQLAGPQIVAQLPTAAPTGGDGISSLFSGLAGLIGTKAPTQPQATQPFVNTGSLAQYANNSFNPQQATQSLMGLNENNPVLKQYLQKANPGLDPAVTPWCAGFVGSVLNASGLKGTGSLMAKSYLNYGTPTDKPQIGDIVVLNRSDDPRLGHVGFFAGMDGNNVKILGGNQHNSVSVQSFPISAVAGYRQPPMGHQVQAFGQQAGLNPQQLANLPNHAQQVPNSVTYSIPNAHPELNSTMQGIYGVESQSSKHPYQAVSIPARDGTRSYGKYQINGKNIPSWTKEALGYPMTTQQFIASPEAQEQTAAFHMNKMLNQGYSPQDVASIWFSGRPQKKAGNAKDTYGTSVPQYVNKFNQGYLRAKVPRMGPLVPGNIDLNNRPKINNKDGSYSTVRTITVEENGKTILLPTIINGKQVSNKEAIDYYHKTGQHMGIFKDQKAADTYDEQLHKQQGWIGPKNNWQQLSMNSRSNPPLPSVPQPGVVPNIRAFDKNVPVRDLTPQEIEVIMRNLHANNDINDVNGKFGDRINWDMVG